MDGAPADGIVNHPLPIENVKPSSGATLLDEAAIKAVRGWTFVPARRGDTPISDLRCGHRARPFSHHKLAVHAAADNKKGGVETPPL